MGPDVEQDTAGSESEASAVSPKDLALFAVRAARDHAVLCVLVGIVAAAIGVTVVSALPRYYESGCKIFVQDNGGAITSSIASGTNHYNPGAATRGLEEIILARDNLMSIVREAKLYDHWPSSRPWPMRIKDRIWESAFGAPARKDMERGMAEMLGGAIRATKDGESVRLSALWRDPQSAFEITRLVQRNFLAARAATDLGPIRRAIPFLEEQQRDADQAIETAVERVHSATTPEEAAPTPSATPAKAGGPSTSTIELANLSRQLAENRREQRALMQPRRERIAQLKIELLDISASYSPEHAQIRQREARIAALSEEPPEVTTLREKEAQILSALASRGVSRTTAAEPTEASSRPQQTNPNDPELAPLQNRLGSLLRKSDDIAGRLEQARIELATAEADFKHRYVVVEEAEVPNSPVKPKGRPLLFVLALVVGMLLGAGTGIAVELRKGRLVDLWQVRSLGIEVLGEVNLK